MKKLQAVLLIDDDEISNSLNQLTLEELEIAEEIKVFSEGEQALEYLKSQSEQLQAAQLLIVDINMPTMDGEEFMLLFNDLAFPNKNKIKTVIYSAHLSGKKYEDLKNLGVNDFIEKPLTSEKMNQLLERMGFCVDSIKE